MIDKKELISTYLQQFGSHYQISRLLNPTLRIDDEFIESKLQKALNYVLKTDKYSDQKIDFPATFLPKRKFLPVPRCPKCHNIMLLTEENGRLKYVCSNVSCDECYEAVIN